MKKIIALTTLLAASTFAVSTASAEGFNNPNQNQQQVQQGFYDESAVVKTVADAQKAQDDTPVRIDGKIVKQLNKKEFLFRDNAGAEIQIEVSKRAWAGQTINPQDQIQIIGEVDKEWNKTEIEVKQIIKK